MQQPSSAVAGTGLHQPSVVQDQQQTSTADPVNINPEAAFSEFYDEVILILFFTSGLTGELVCILAICGIESYHIILMCDCVVCSLYPGLPCQRYADPQILTFWPLP